MFKFNSDSRHCEALDWILFNAFLKMLLSVVRPAVFNWFAIKSFTTSTLDNMCHRVIKIKGHHSKLYRFTFGHKR